MRGRPGVRGDADATLVARTQSSRASGYNVSVGKRSRGTGHLYEKWGSYYGRWRTLDGRFLNRLIGPVRTPGSSDGLTRAQAEREFRHLQDA